MRKLSLILLLLIVHFLSLELNAQTAEIDSLENLLQQYTKKDTIRVNLLNETASKLYSINADRSLKYANEAGELAAQTNFAKGKAESLRLKGIYYIKKSDYPKALENFQKAFKIYEGLNHKIGISKSLNIIGAVYHFQKDYPKALEYYQKSLKIAEELNDKKLISYCLNNIGIIYNDQKDYPKALEYYQKSLNLSEELSNKKGISYCLNNIGVIYYHLDDYPNALEYYQKAIKISIEINNKYIETKNYLGIVSLHLKQGKTKEAYYYSKKAYKLAKELGNIELLASSTEKMAKSSEALGLYKEAYKYHVVFKTMNDSIFNKENIKKVTELEYQYKYEKEKQATELIQQKKDAVLAEETKKQKIIRNSFILGFVLMAMLVFVVLRSYLQKHKANRILAFQKREIEEKNSELHEQNEEIQQLNEELSSTNEQLYSQREELEATLNKLKGTQSQLVQSEKMASVGILTAGIAHEINNPLNFINGGKAIIENYITENLEDHKTELMPLIGMIETGVSRASEIVESLNRFSRTNKSITENCDIHSIIDNCLLMLNNQIKNDIKIVKNFTNIPYELIGNEGRLHQAILNILTNAIQAINKKGNISISTNLEKENLIIKIADTGSGISEENIKKITDPFFTTKDPGKGTGLGLSIAYNIIKEHKGSIKFESTEGEGTTVTITFPITQ